MWWALSNIHTLNLTLNFCLMYLLEYRSSVPSMRSKKGITGSKKTRNVPVGVYIYFTWQPNVEIIDLGFQQVWLFFTPVRIFRAMEWIFLKPWHFKGHPKIDPKCPIRVNSMFVMHHMWHNKVILTVNKAFIYRHKWLGHVIHSFISSLGNVNVQYNIV